MFCDKCGKNMGNRNDCPYCENGKKDEYLFLNIGKKWDFKKNSEENGTSRFIAGVLQLFAGSIGLGRFYMKSYKIGIIQLIVTVTTFLMSAYIWNAFSICGFIWGFADGIMILSGKIECDGKNNVMSA